MSAPAKKRAAASPRPAPTDRSDERRADLLATAVQIFGRYGFKKTSMDEIARAAGLSRQGLYLHFDSKETLFRAGVTYIIERTRTAARAALADTTRTPGERLLAAFEAMHAHFVGALGGVEHIAELLEASTRLVGDQVEEADRAFADDIVKALAAAGVVERWADVGVGTRELANYLVGVSRDLKHRVSSRSEYVKGMRAALRITLRSRNP